MNEPLAIFGPAEKTTVLWKLLQSQVDQLEGLMTVPTIVQVPTIIQLLQRPMRQDLTYGNPSNTMVR